MTEQGAAAGPPAQTAPSVRERLRRFAEGVHSSATPWNLGAWAFLGYMLATNHQFMHFNYHMHLAEAFLHGRLDIPDPPSWLTEFARFNGRNYVFFGPMPAVLLLPLVAVFHLNFNLAYACVTLGAINVALVFRLLERLGCARATSVWLTMLFGIGSVQLWVATYGNTWLFAQLCANFFLLLGALEVLGKRRGPIVGLMLGAAVLSREATALALPFYLVLLAWPPYDRPDGRHTGPPCSRWQGLAGFLGGLAVLGLAAAWYNWARFGNPFDNGYLYGNQSIWRPAHGSFSLHYLIGMLPVYFWRGPTFVPHPPFAVLTDHGLSLFWTTPAFLLLFPAARAALAGWPGPDARVRLAAWLALIPMAALYLLYFWDGWRQFGARYALDYTPFILVILGLHLKGGPTPLLRILTVASVVVNVWGIAWWRLHKW